LIWGWYRIEWFNWWICSIYILWLLLLILFLLFWLILFSFLWRLEILLIILINILRLIFLFWICISIYSGIRLRIINLLIRPIMILRSLLLWTRLLENNIIWFWFFIVLFIRMFWEFLHNLFLFLTYWGRR
jgi:hypothetical protein